MSGINRNYDEKRNFIRMTMNSNATLTQESGVSITVKCRDLSATGMLVHSNESLTVGASVEINIPSPKEQFPTKVAKGKVLRCDEVSPGAFELGVSIESIN